MWTSLSAASSNVYKEGDLLASFQLPPSPTAFAFSLKPLSSQPFRPPLIASTMVKIALTAALLALGVVSAMPVERAAPIPDVISGGGRLSVVGIGAQNSNFNKTATFDGRSGKLTLGSMASGISVVSGQRDATSSSASH